jgi:hypothetical protein
MIESLFGRSHSDQPPSFEENAGRTTTLGQHVATLLRPLGPRRVRVRFTDTPHPRMLPCNLHLQGNN